MLGKELVDLAVDVPGLDARLTHLPGNGMGAGDEASGHGHLLHFATAFEFLHPDMGTA